MPLSHTTWRCTGVIALDKLRMWQVLSCIFSSFAYRYQLGPQLKFITVFSKPDDLLPCCTFLHVVKLQESLRVVRLTTIHRDPTLITENEDIRRFAQTFVFCLCFDPRLVRIVVGAASEVIEVVI